MPEDYSDAALNDPTTRAIMSKIDFAHGGDAYDAKYPDGIPTTIEIDHAGSGCHSSGLVMYPEGHARSTSGNLDGLLADKFRRLASLAMDDVDGLERRMTGLVGKSAEEVGALYEFSIRGVQ